MRAPTLEGGHVASPFRLALFWLGVQAVWGALLGISLQSRTIELASGSAVLAYGRLATMGAATAAVVQILVGIWSDARRRNGSRRLEFYLAGAVGGAAAIAAFYDARTFFALSVAFIALQAALNVAIGPYQAIIPDFVEGARVGTASSWMAALQSVGNAVGALAASFIANARTLSYALAALLLTTCALTSAHARALPLRESIGPSRLHVTRPFVDLFVSRALVYVGFYTLLGYLLFYVQNVLGASVLADARRLTGVLIISFTIVGALGAALAARPSDRADKRLVATLGALGFIVALALFITVNRLGGAVAATIVAGLGWGVFLVADWAIACRVLPAGAMAAAMGIWNLAVVLPQVVAPALTTAVLTRFQLIGGPVAPRVAFGLALAETVAGIAWLWRLPRCLTNR
ncbi:MAG: MFS transporter [Candidatus Eremiobacteraeota bacterium]|nr:MFS transporter [Candidatus Eremiobacteraeota bacterium]